MKKFLLTSLTLLFAFILVACGNSSSKKETVTSTTSKMSQVELVLSPLDSKKTTKTVTVKKDATAMDVVDQAFDVEQKDGFITSIDGKAQNEAKNIYWLFKVNGKDASKGANDVKVKEGDKLEFYQKKLTN